jgi:hypothetical protein
MSIEVSVFSDRALASTEEWQRALDAEGLPLKLDPTVGLTEASGFFPARLNDKLTGFECYREDAAELIESYPDFDFGKAWTCALGFRVGGDFTELLAAFMAATAYARATGGVVWDGESGEVMLPDRAREVTRDIERDASASELFPSPK